MKNKKLVLLFTCFLLSLVATGCRSQIFVEEEVPETTKVFKLEGLENESYYIKDGTSFYKLYSPSGNITSYSTEADAKRILWTNEEEDDLIPTLYKNEVLIYMSDGDVPKDIVFERFKDLGYSIGISDITADDATGYYNFHTANNVKEGSSAQEEMNKVKETYSTLALASLNGKQISDVTKAGTISGLKKDKSYTMSVYAGTMNSETKVKADTHIYQSSETFVVEKVETTEKGYVIIPIPKGLKTGYYMVNGAGLIRYIDDLKIDAGDLAEYDYNIANEIELKSTALDETVMDSTTSVTFNIDSKCEEAYITFSVTQDMKLTSAELVTPKDKAYQFEKVKDNETAYQVTLKNPPQGTYKVIYVGKNIGELMPVVNKYGEEKKPSSEKNEDTKEDKEDELTAEEEKAIEDALDAADLENSEGVTVIED